MHQNFGGKTSWKQEVFKLTRLWPSASWHYKPTLRMEVAGNTLPLVPISLNLLVLKTSSHMHATL